MFIFYLFEVYMLGTFLKCLFLVLIVFGICWALYRFYHYKKASYVLDNIDNVVKIEFMKPKRQYKTAYEETGYSYNWRYYTTHYKAKRVAKHLVYKGTAFFKNGKTLKFQIVENSETYRRIIDRVA